MAVPVDNPGASGPGVCTDSANGTQGDAPYVSNRLRYRHLTSPSIINIQLTTSFLSVILNINAIAVRAQYWFAANFGCC